MMKTLHLAGAAALALFPGALLAQPASSDRQPDVTPQQTPGQPAQQSGTPAPAAPSAAPSSGSAGTPLDTRIDEADAPPPPAAPTGNAVLDRLNALESKIDQLQAQNKALQDQVDADQARIQSVEVRSAKAVQFGWGPVLSDVGGKFTFKPRGVIDADFVHFDERRGGYDFNDGTGFRRARLGFQGTAFKNFNWVVEADFAGDVVTLQDAYLQYVGLKKLAITIGQFKEPFGFESNNSDNYNIFMERGMANNAFANAGAERRIGASLGYVSDTLNATVSASGENESVGRASTTYGASEVPDESWGVNGRVTWEPVFEDGKILHVGVGGYRRWKPRSGDTPDAIRLSDRPDIRVDNGNIADSGVIGVETVNKASIVGEASTERVTALNYIGAEAAGVFGPAMIFGEYNRLTLHRPEAYDPKFDGFYVAGSFFLTGETHPFRNGNLDRVKPFANLGENGGWGAFELTARYDKIDLSDTPVALRTGNEASSWTAGLTWYLNPYAKILFNYVRFKGDMTSLVAQPAAPAAGVVGTAKGDAFATRLHLDF